MITTVIITVSTVITTVIITVSIVITTVIRTVSIVITTVIITVSIVISTVIITVSIVSKTASRRTEKDHSLLDYVMGGASLEKTGSRSSRGDGRIADLLFSEVLRMFAGL